MHMYTHTHKIFADRGCASPKFCVMVIAPFFHENRSNNDFRKTFNARANSPQQVVKNKIIKKKLQAMQKRMVINVDPRLK